MDLSKYDLDGNGVIGQGDLAMLLGAWGQTVPPPAPVEPQPPEPAPSATVRPVLVYTTGGAIVEFDPTAIAGFEATPFSTGSWNVTRVYWRTGGATQVYVAWTDMAPLMADYGWAAPRVYGTPPQALLDAIMQVGAP